MLMNEIDHGDILAQREVPILPNDTPETLHERIQVEERTLYPEVIVRFCPKPLGALRLLVSLQEFLQTLQRWLAFIDDGIDLIDDRRFHIELPRAL